MRERVMEQRKSDGWRQKEKDGWGTRKTGVIGWEEKVGKRDRPGESGPFYTEYVVLFWPVLFWAGF